MANSSLFSKSFRLILAGVLLSSTCTVTPVWSEDLFKPFPVLGSITVKQGHWDDLPDSLLRLPETVQSPSIRFQLTASAAEEYFRQNMWDESRKAFQKLLKAKKPSTSTFLQQISNLRLAEITLLQGKPDEALQLIQPYIRNANPYISGQALLLQARCYLYKHQWDSVETAISELLEKNPAYEDDLLVNLLEGVSALEQGHMERAYNYFKRFPDEPAALYYEVVCKIRSKKLSDALPMYQSILQNHSDSEWLDRVRLVLGEAFYEVHDRTSARQFLEPVTRPQVEPDLRALALHRMACLDFQEQKFDESERILTDLLKNYPNHPLRSQWSYLYASVPIFQKDWKKAIQEQKTNLSEERGLASRATGVDAYQLKLSAQFRILWAHLLLNDFSGTRDLAEKFIQHYPNEPMVAYAYLAKGLAYYRDGNYDQAIQAYQTLLNRYPNTSAYGKTVYLLTLCLHSARDPFHMASVLNDVHTHLQQAVDRPADEWTENTLYWLADGYAQINDWSNAEKIYREFISRAPQSALVPYALEALGSVLSAQGPNRDADAIVALQQAELRARDLGNKELADQAELERGKVYYNQRDFSRATAVWDHLVEVSTFPVVRAEAMYRQGDGLTRQQYYVEAIKRWQELVHTYEKDKTNKWVPQALIRIGTTQEGLGQWSDATKTYTYLKNNWPNTSEGKEGAFQLVQCAFNQGDLPTAVSMLLAYAKDHPDDDRISKTADNLLSAFRQKKVTIPASEQVALLKLAPGSAGGAALLWEKGAALFNEEKYEMAQKIFEKIMLSYPNVEYAPMAYFYNADCLFWMKRWDDAANAYQTFFLSFPKHERVPTAMFQKAVSLFRKGAYDDAVSDFQQFLHKYPNHALAKDAWLDIALAHKKAFHLDQAVEAYQYFVRHYPDDPKMNSVWIQMGSLMEVQGHRAEAASTYAKVPPNAPEYPEALFRRAELLEEDHKVAEEIQVLQALQKMPEAHNEFRVGALLKLSELYEQEGAPPEKLRPLYKDIQSSSTDPEVVKQAGQRLQELGQ